MARAQIIQKRKNYQTAANFISTSWALAVREAHSTFALLGTMASKINDLLNYNCSAVIIELS